MPIELHVEALDLVLVILRFDLVLGQIDDGVIFLDFDQYLLAVECDLVIIHVAEYGLFPVFQIVSAKM